MRVFIKSIVCNNKNTYIIGWSEGVKVILIVDFTYYLLLTQKQFNKVSDLQFKSYKKVENHKLLRNKHKTRTDIIYKVEFTSLKEYKKCKYALKDELANVAPETLFCVHNKISINDWIAVNGNI